MPRVTSALALVFVIAAAPLSAQGAPEKHQSFDYARYLYSPGTVMKRQRELALTDVQQLAVQTAMRQAQTAYFDLQWRLNAEEERLSTVLQGKSLNESEVLAQVGRVLALEREIKLVQMTLLVRIKNILTPAQRAQLAPPTSKTP
jgi:Spy/CpxP family protein refolding chaperone